MKRFTKLFSLLALALMCAGSAWAQSTEVSFGFNETLTDKGDGTGTISDYQAVTTSDKISLEWIQTEKTGQYGVVNPASISWTNNNVTYTTSNGVSVTYAASTSETSPYGNEVFYGYKVVVPEKYVLNISHMKSELLMNWQSSIQTIVIEKEDGTNLYTSDSNNQYKGTYRNLIDKDAAVTLPAGTYLFKAVTAQQGGAGKQQLPISFWFTGTLDEAQKTLFKMNFTEAYFNAHKTGNDTDGYKIASGTEVTDGTDQTGTLYYHIDVTRDATSGAAVMSSGNMKTTNYWISIPLKGINGKFTVKIADPATDKAIKNLAVAENTTDYKNSYSDDEYIGTISASGGYITYTYNMKNGNEATLFIGRNGYNSTQFTSIEITTPETDRTVRTSSANLQGYKTFYDADNAYSIDSNTKIYVVEQNEDDATTVTVRSVDNTIIPAATPVLLKTTASDYKMTLTQSNEAGTEITSGLSVYSSSEGTPTNVYVLGYLDPVKYPNVANGFGLYPYDTDLLTEGQVYLSITTSGSGEAKVSIVEFIPTAINNVNASTSSAQAKAEGKYIKNGKLVIVKNGKQYNAAGQLVK